MPMHFDLLHRVFRVIGDKPDGGTVVGNRRGTIGSGFVLTVNSEILPGQSNGYFVTAHHVVQDQNTVELQAATPQPGGLNEPLVVSNWQQPDPKLDLVVAFITEPLTFQAFSLELHFLPESPLLPPLGGSIYYLGMFEPLDRPMLRAGVVGAVNVEGIPHDRQFDVEYDYAAHLVDCRSYGGFSGSPVLLETEHASLTPNPRPFPVAPDAPLPVGDMQYHSHVCGMFTEHFDQAGRSNAISRFGVGVVLPSADIRRALMSEALRAERDEADRQWASGNYRET